jgi:hypothetical protein
MQDMKEELQKRYRNPKKGSDWNSANEQFNKSNKKFSGKSLQ